MRRLLWGTAVCRWPIGPVGCRARQSARGSKRFRPALPFGEGRIRRSGGGRKRITVTDPRLVDALEALIDEQTRGDPDSPLRWICQSTRAIAQQLERRRHPISHMKVAQMLHDLHYKPAEQPKNRVGRGAPGPRRPVSPHRHCGQTVSRPGPAGHFGRHQEEGVDRELPICGPTVAPVEGAKDGARPRLPRVGCAPRVSVRDLRSRPQQRFRQYRHGP